MSPHSAQSCACGNPLCPNPYYVNPKGGWTPLPGGGSGISYEKVTPDGYVYKPMPDPYTKATKVTAQEATDMALATWQAMKAKPKSKGYNLLTNYEVVVVLHDLTSGAQIAEPVAGTVTVSASTVSVSCPTAIPITKAGIVEVKVYTEWESLFPKLLWATSQIGGNNGSMCVIPGTTVTFHDATVTL